MYVNSGYDWHNITGLYGIFPSGHWRDYYIVTIFSYASHWNPGANRFTKRVDILPQDLVKSRNREIRG